MWKNIVQHLSLSIRRLRMQTLCSFPQAVAVTTEFGARTQPPVSNAGCHVNDDVRVRRGGVQAIIRSWGKSGRELEPATLKCQRPIESH